MENIATLVINVQPDHVGHFWFRYIFGHVFSLGTQPRQLRDDTPSDCQNLLYIFSLNFKANSTFCSISQSELVYHRGAGADSCLQKLSWPVPTQGLRCACACCVLHAAQQCILRVIPERFHPGASVSGECTDRHPWVCVCVCVVLDSLWQMSSLWSPQAVRINIAVDKKSPYPVSARRFH